MGVKCARLAASERGVWFSWKMHGIYTPHFNRKYELTLFRGRKRFCPQILEPRFRPFANGTGAANPSTFAEAAERPIYTALNTRGVDAGNPEFGPISVVFETGYVRDMAFVTAADSGAWVAICNATFNQGHVEAVWPGPLDCTQPTAPGTFGALNHVVLASERLWRPSNGSSSPLVSMLARLYQRPPPPVST